MPSGQGFVAKGYDGDPAAVEVRGLRRSYGGLQAVDGVDLTIRRGEIFALLGPNGAGKTTTVEILEGFRSRDGGTVSVLGCDPATDRPSFVAVDWTRLDPCDLWPCLLSVESD